MRPLTSKEIRNEATATRREALRANAALRPEEDMTDATSIIIPASERLLSEKSAAEFLGLSVRTLQRFRVTGEGPIFSVLGQKRIAYLYSDLLAFVAKRRFASTSAADHARRAE